MPIPQFRLHGISKLSWPFGAVVIAAATFAGCQSVTPAGTPSILAKREDAKIAKLARADSFPSPADVGLADDGGSTTSR